MLYRGQRRREWLLDSTFVRSCKSIIFGIPVEQKLKASFVESSNYHHALVALYLLKFSEIVQPSEELYALEKSKGIDAWFELLKRMQQHPEIDTSAIKGSNFVDWSESSDIALYFANEGRDGEGAVFVCDASSTGKTIPLKSVDEVLNLMAEIRDKGQALGAPLLFSPERQIAYQRAKNQQARYFSQMDMRYDLESIWRKRESELQGQTVLVKVVLAAESVDEANEYLQANGISRDFVYPS